MPKEMERKLKAEAKSKGLSGEHADAYVYGTLRKTGWKPKPHHVATGSMHEIVHIDEGAMFGDRVVSDPCGSEEHSGAVQGPVEPRVNRPLGYGAADQKRNTPLEETLEHQLEEKGR